MSAGKEPTTVRLNLALRQDHCCWDDPDVQEYTNKLLERAPDSWDDDVAAESIAIAYVRHLEDEVKRLGGCLKKYCWDTDPEEYDGPCDHGYR
jgi:hypothetical protein